MLPEAKERLIFLYTKMTGAILTFVVIVALCLVLWIEQRNERALFNQVFDGIMTDIAQEAVISTTWIKKQPGSLVLWDNGLQMPVPGKGLMKEEERLLEVCIQKGEKKGLLLIRPVPGKKQDSQSFWLLGEGLRLYFGGIGVAEVEGGFRSLVYLYPYSDIGRAFGLPVLGFFLFDLLGLFALYFMNRRLIDRVLEPVEKARQRQTEFIAAASHELRSPLAVMKANLAAARGREDKDEFFRIMQKECDRLGSLTEDLLLLAAADAGQWQLEKHPLDMEGLLIELYESYEAVFRRKGIRLCLDFPEASLPKLSSDANRIKQLLSILLTNALRFAPEGSEVRLQSWIDGKKKCLYLAVEDHGKGIPKELQEKVFERFYQADASRGEGEHFGLGLSIAKELAVLLGGELSYRETPGGGATFLFSLSFR